MKKTPAWMLVGAALVVPVVLYVVYSCDVNQQRNEEDACIQRGGHVVSLHDPARVGQGGWICTDENGKVLQ